MERLAKEKIASQNRILLLKRELAQWDIDFSKLIPETDINSIKAERGRFLLGSVFLFEDLLKCFFYYSG